MRLIVESDATVRLTALSGQGRVDGEDITDATGGGVPWLGGTFDTSGRAFRLVRHLGSAGGRDTLSRAQADAVSGSIVFNRPPRAAPASPGPPLVLPATPSSKRVDRSTSERFRRALSERWTADRDRLRNAHPDLAEAIEAAQRRDPSLWQRRRGDPDAFCVPIGLGDLPWSPPLEPEPLDPASAALHDGDDWVAAIIDTLGPLPMVPVVVDLDRGRGVGIVGPAPSGRALARGLLIEAAVTHGPVDLGVVILTTDERAPSWEWVKWLPHVRASGTHGVITSRAGFEQWSSRTLSLRNAADRAAATTPSPITLVVVDGPVWWRDRDAPLRALFADDTLPLRFIALAATRADVPAPCTTVVTSHPDDSVSVEHVAERRQVGGVLPFLATAADALQVARRLSPLEDPELPEWAIATTGRPSSVSMVELLGLDEADARTFAVRWPAAAPDASVTLGRRDDGPFRVDLEAQGPHMLIVDGADGGQLVASVVAGLAVDHPPNELQIVILAGGDSGGLTIGESLADLPHVVGVVTDVDRSRCERVVRSLRSEIRRRNATTAPGRLIVVVEDCAALATAVPDFLASLVELGRQDARGGVHLILATRELPSADAGIADLIDIADVRVIAGTRDDATSVAVIGTPAAAHADVDEPGRAWLRRRDGAPIAFQAPWHVAATPPPQGVEVVPFVVAREPTAMERRLERARATALTDADDAVLAQLVSAMTQAANELGLGDRRQVIPDPLPEAIAMRAFFDEHPGDGVPFALVDDLDAQRLSPAWWEPADGDLLAVGPDAARVLLTVGLGIAERHSPDDVHLYIVDSGAGRLAPLGRIPHCGALVAPRDRDRLADLAHFLVAEIDRRSALAGELGGPQRVAASEPSIVVMIADAGELVTPPDGVDGTDPTSAAFERSRRDGRTLGICTVVAAADIAAVPEWLADENRLVIDLSVATDGVTVTPSRARRTDDGATIQLVDPPTDVRATVGALGLEPASQRPPRPVRSTPPPDADRTDTSP